MQSIESLDMQKDMQRSIESIIRDKKRFVEKLLPKDYHAVYSSKTFKECSNKKIKKDAQ